MHHTMVLTIAILLLPLAIQPSSATSADTSCGIIWDEPILLSDTNYNASSPRIALSGEDTVHITWLSSARIGFPDLRFPYVRSLSGGDEFEQPRELLIDSVAFPFYAYTPQIVANANRVYAFFVGSTAGRTPVRLIESSDAGDTWSMVRDISQDSVPRIESTAILGDTLSLIFAPPPYHREILRSTDRGSTWAWTNNSLNEFARVALSPGVLHLVQNVQPGSSIETLYRRSTDLGDTWIQQEILSDVDGWESSLPTIGSSDNGGILTAWREAKFGCLTWVGCGVAGRLSLDAGVTFANETRFDVQASGYDATIAARGNSFAVAWADDLDGYIKLRVSYDAGATWYGPMNASHVGGGRPQIVLSQMAIHVIWASGNGDPGNSVRVFYRRGIIKTTDVSDVDSTLPSHVSLEQNYPNPFSAKSGSASGGNPSTSIKFCLPAPSAQHRGAGISSGINGGFTSLKVYDALGREVATLVDERKEPGEHTVEWNALTNSGQVLPSGVYYYRLVSGDRIETKKAILLK